jgi:hypothetical protein
MRRYKDAGKALNEALPGDWIRWPDTQDGHHYVVETVTLNTAFIRSTLTETIHRVARSDRWLTVVVEDRPVTDEVYLNLYTGLHGGQLRASAWPSRGAADRAIGSVRRTGLVRVTTEDDKPVKVELL